MISLILFFIIFFYPFFSSIASYLDDIDYDWASVDGRYLEQLFTLSKKSIKTGLPIIKRSDSEYQEAQRLKRELDISQDKEDEDEELVVYKPGQDI